jgi:hypothetical protein
MDKDERSQRNIALARELGEKYGRIVSTRLIPEIILKYEWEPAPLRPVAGLLLTELVADVTAGMRTRRDDGLPSLHRSTREHLTSHLDTALRLLEFYPTIRFDGVLVSVANTDEKIALENGLGVAPLFDIFNPRARAIVLGGLAAVYEPGDDVALGDWARWAAQSDRGLEVMSQQAASIGFMTLFADSLRSVVQAFMSGNASSSVDFTFHSKPPGGYQVQYHPQYYTSPVVFGPNLSTPVTKKSVLAGNYHFLGQLGTAPAIRDPALYTVSSGSTSGTTNVF